MEEDNNNNNNDDQQLNYNRPARGGRGERRQQQQHEPQTTAATAAARYSERTPLISHVRTPKGHLDQARRLLYISHTFAQFSEQTWQFALILFLGACTNYQSLLLISTYGLVSGSSICWFGTQAGKFVDGSGRLFVARFFIWTENVCVLIATALCYWLLSASSLASSNLHQQRLDDDDDAAAAAIENNQYNKEINDNYSNETILLASSSASAATTTTTTWLSTSKFLQNIPLDPLSIALLLGIHIFGSLASVLDKGFLVAMERDWVVVMSQVANFNALIETPNKHWLSETNVAMKQIDLTCRVVAPAVAGFVVGAFDSSTSTATTTAMKNDGDDDDDDTSTNTKEQEEASSSHSMHGRNLTGAAILVGAVNVAALIVEYFCTARIYAMIPPLADARYTHSTRFSNNNNNNKARRGVVGSIKNLKSPLNDDDDVDADDNDDESSLDNKSQSTCGIFRIPSGLQTYFSQPISLAGLRLALLYLNALTFGALMTGFLVWKGMKLETVGLWRGVSAGVGLLGTFAFHSSSMHFTLVTTGMWSIVYEFACLSIAFWSLFVSDYHASVVMLIAGTCLSRIGLWVFDITVTQLMQEFIPDGMRGLVGGTQQSLNAFFLLLSYGLGLIFPDPRQFHIYAASGYAAVGVAMVLFFVCIVKNRDSFLTSLERARLPF